MYIFVGLICFCSLEPLANGRNSTNLTQTVNFINSSGWKPHEWHWIGLSTSAVCWILTYFLKLADQLTHSNCYWGKYVPTQVSKVNKFYRCYHFLPFTEIDRFEWYDATWNVLKIIIRRNLKIHISENFQQTFASSSAWHWKSQFQFENRLLYNFCTESDVIIEWDVIQFENLCWKTMNFEVNGIAPFCYIMCT